MSIYGIMCNSFKQLRYRGGMIYRSVVTEIMTMTPFVSSEDNLGFEIIRKRILLQRKIKKPSEEERQVTIRPQR